MIKSISDTPLQNRETSKMTKDQIAVCIFCRPGNESLLAQTIRDQLDQTVLVPIRMQEEVHHGKYLQVQKPLLPGYIFAYMNSIDLVTPIQALPLTRKVLSYEEGNYVLVGNDRAFADWLYRYDGVIGVSRAMLVNGKVDIIDGPMKDYEGIIKKIDKQKHRALIEINVGGTISKTWLSFAWMEMKDGKLVRWQKSTDILAA